MSSPAVTVLDVAKRYGTHEALRGISFEIRPGEAVGYLGPNGAGKTTTLKLLTGLARPDRGTVRILGADPVRERTSAMRRVGALVETPGVPSYLTGRDLLTYVARTKGISPAEAASSVRQAADALSVSAQLDRPFGSLSTGLARRMLLASALVGDPEVLLLDEPTLGLDPSARHDLRGVLRRLAREGRTILLSTHLLDDVQEVCDRVLFLRDGALVGDEPVNPDRPSAGGTPEVRLVVAFAVDVPLERLTAVLGSAVHVTAEGSRRVRIRGPGGPTAQAELLARLVRADLPVVSAAPPEPDLARRYMERVGREDAT